MTGTSSRTLQLLGLLQSRRHWIGTDLADRLDVSLRTLRRDVDRLRELGYPVQADRGVGGGYQLAHGASLPPLVLDHDEAVSVTIGPLNCAHTPVAGVAEASVRALAKVIPVMPPRLRHEVTTLQAATTPTTSPWSGTDINPDDMVTVAQACRDSERLRFDYTAADGAQSHRRIEPAQLVTLGRHWYLVGFDLDWDDWRTFRLDQLSNATSTRQIVQPREVPGRRRRRFCRGGPPSRWCHGDRGVGRPRGRGQGADRVEGDVRHAKRRCGHRNRQFPLPDHPGEVDPGLGRVHPRQRRCPGTHGRSAGARRPAPRPIRTVRRGRSRRHRQHRRMTGQRWPDCSC